MADHTPPTEQQLGGQHGYDCPPSEPDDQTALRNRIAEVLAVRFTADGDISQGMRVIDPDGEEDAEPARRVRPVEAADAIMPVLPPPTDRAAVLLEAADDLAEFIALHGPTSRTVAGWRGAVGFLRRMADEAQQPTPVAAFEPRANETGGTVAEAQQQPTDEDVVEAHRLALSFALGLGTGAPWDAIRDRAAELHGVEAQQQPDTETPAGANTPLICSDERHATKVAALEQEVKRVRDVCDQLRRTSVLTDGEPHTDRERGIVQAVTRVLSALDEEG